MVYKRTALVFVLGVLLSGLASWHQAGENQQQLLAKLTQATQGLEADLLAAFKKYEYGLRGARGVILVTDGQPGRERFRQYSESRDLDKEFPGARGIGFIRRAPLREGLHK